MRPTGGEFDTTIVMLDLAQTEYECRLLECARRFSTKNQQIACGILELLAG